METIKTLHDLEEIKKSEVCDKNGLTYKDFRKNLSPNYTIVWRDIIFGYLALVSSILLFIYLINYFPKLLILSLITQSIIIGYIIAYLHLFVHEAAHYNIAKSRVVNDILCNIFLCSLIGLNIKSYRTIHWDHHRNLGQPNDSEHSYFDPLNLRYLLESLIGYKSVKVILNRKAKTNNQPTEKSNSNSDLLMFLTGLIINMTIVAISFLYGYWQLSIAWIAGVFIFFPFFGALRQLLEHRDEIADNDVDYSKIKHGRFSRLFNDGLLGSTLGGAGFNRHMLHHWDPQISYSNLNEVERFLFTSNIGEGIKKAKTNYITTFLKLFSY